MSLWGEAPVTGARNFPSAKKKENEEMNSKPHSQLPLTETKGRKACFFHDSKEMVLDGILKDLLA